MVLQSAKGLAAYKIPSEVKKKSWAKKKKKRKNKKGLPQNPKEIYKK